MNRGFNESFLDDPDLSEELKDMIWFYLDCRPHIRYEQALEDCRDEIERLKNV